MGEWVNLDYLCAATTLLYMIALYFGSFNPVHVGHVSLGRYLLDHHVADEVWFVVSPCNPLKHRADLLDEQERLHMLRLAIRDYPCMKASDVEFSLPVPSYTVDTLSVLSGRHPDARFALVIGSDNALLFHRWKDSERILAHYPVLVYPRRGYDFASVAERFPQMHLLPTPYYDVSSTEIREGIARGEDVSRYLDPLVWQHIREKGLYQ